MRNFWISCLALLLLNCSEKSPPATVDPPSVPESIVPAQVDSVITYLKPFPEHTQVAMALIRDTATTFWGVVREDDTLKTVENRQSVFEIGSITKVFTTALLSQLAQEGKVTLDDSIAQYLTIPLNPRAVDAPKITLRQLANHTSGLPRMPGNFTFTVRDPSNPYKNYGPEELKAYLTKGVRLKSVPGEQYAYSNLGVGLLGYILAQATNQSYPSLLQERIFDPVSMQNSVAGMEELSTSLKFMSSSPLVEGRDSLGNPTANWELNAMQPAGGILSTVEDLSKFVRANFQKNAAFDLQKETTFEVSDQLALGLGWHIRREDGQEWYWHNGATNGYRACLVLDDVAHRGVVILSNVSAFHSFSPDIDHLAFSLMVK